MIKRAAKPPNMPPIIDERAPRFIDMPESSEGVDEVEGEAGLPGEVLDDDEFKLLADESSDEAGFTVVEVGF